MISEKSRVRTEEVIQSHSSNSGLGLSRSWGTGVNGDPKADKWGNKSLSSQYVVLESRGYHTSYIEVAWFIVTSTAVLFPWGFWIRGAPRLGQARIPGSLPCPIEKSWDICWTCSNGCATAGELCLRRCRRNGSLNIRLRYLLIGDIRRPASYASRVNFLVLHSWIPLRSPLMLSCDDCVL